METIKKQTVGEEEVRLALKALGSKKEGRYRPLTDEQYQKAIESGKKKLATEVHAMTSEFDAGRDEMRIVFSSGQVMVIAIKEIPELRNLPPEQLSLAYITPGGSALSIDEADVDISMSFLSRIAVPLSSARAVVAANNGTVHTEAKAEAARRNGTLGGRPPKIQSVLIDKGTSNMTKHYPHGLDNRQRDQDGRIRQKRSDTLVGTLRKELGENFEKEYRSDTKLGTILKDKGVSSLDQLKKKK